MLTKQSNARDMTKIIMRFRRDSEGSIFSQRAENIAAIGAAYLSGLELEILLMRHKMALYVVQKFCLIKSITKRCCYK